MSEKTNTMKKNKEVLLKAIRMVGIELNTEKTKYVLCLITKMQDKIAIY